jgi:TonB family protein
MALAAAGWYSMTAFPLSALPAAAPQLLPTAGPIEARANRITPENPIPRRLSATTPIYPLEAADVGAHGTVTLKVILDESGRVAETRRAAFLGGTAQPGITISLQSDPLPSVEEALRAAGTLPDGSEQLVSAIEALFRSASDAVGQWHYDPPADGPIAFYVRLLFSPDSNPSMLSQGPAPPTGGPRAIAVNTPGVSGRTAGAAAGAAGGPLRVGGNMPPPRKIRDVRPVYPAIARTAKVQGVVILETTIGADGRVSSARVIRSLPLLDQAALDAVRQWEFTPTLLNGVPTPIIMTVTVNFSLPQ